MRSYLLCQTVESDGGDEEHTTSLQSVGHAAAHCVHVVTLRLDVGRQRTSPILKHLLRGMPQLRVLSIRVLQIGSIAQLSSLVRRYIKRLLANGGIQENYLSAYVAMYR